MATLNAPETIAQIVAECSKKPQDAIVKSQDLFAEGIVDSFGILEVITQLEAKFGISIPNDELTSQNFRSVGHITELIAKLS